MYSTSAIHALSLAVLNYGKAGNSLEVAKVSGDDAVAEFECSDADEDVGKGKIFANLRKRTVQTTGSSCNG